MPQEDGDAQTRVATEADLDRLSVTLAAAFRGDPLWNWAFPDHAKLEPWWRFLIASALRHPWVWVAADVSAAAVWIPPGGTELTADEEQQVEPLLKKLVGPRAGEVMDLLERFESSHPRTEPHYYLSLLGTHPEHRGRGLGMRLLAQNLSMIDMEGLPAYLESSNPHNDKRYERLGFTKVGMFSTPDGAHSVTTMWRQPG
jgi:GNAT superfamily N-acetyltransferase